MEVKNDWQLSGTNKRAVFECWIEPRVKEFFIEKFDLEIEFMQAEEKDDTPGRKYYKVIVEDAVKIIIISEFCKTAMFMGKDNSPN